MTQLLIGILIGLVAGFVIANKLDKPEIVNHIGKQKRGRFLNIFKRKEDENNS